VELCYWWLCSVDDCAFNGMFNFFFQAEDGIRDATVTGVQTCALPIFLDRLVGDVELANAVPLGGVPAEIGLGGAGALRPHRGQPLPITRERRVVGVKAGNELAGKLG